MLSIIKALHQKSEKKNQNQNAYIAN